MLRRIQGVIDSIVRRSVRNALLDWPMDLGVDTAIFNGVIGDYHEFGVFKGRSFIKNAKSFMRRSNRENGKAMRFCAYDSFEGLPETNDPYAPEHFKKGAFSATQEEFVRNVTKTGIDIEQVKIVAGFYDKTLDEQLSSEVFQDRKIAMTYIDCDIYESAVPIFDYITPGLQVGTIIVIDDWIRHHSHPNFGIQRAFNEWRDAHPKIQMSQIALTKRVTFVVYEI